MQKGRKGRYERPKLKEVEAVLLWMIYEMATREVNLTKAECRRQSAECLQKEESGLSRAAAGVTL